MDDLEYLLKTTRIIRECREILKESNDAAADSTQPESVVSTTAKAAVPLPAEAVSEFLEDK